MLEVVVVNNSPSVVRNFSYNSYWCPSCKSCLATDFGSVIPIPNCLTCKVELKWNKEILDNHLLLATMKTRKVGDNV
jgi:hypothetical protein